jgi:F-type H+-transporting ATPase subunit a
MSSFEVKNILPIDFFGFDISITNSSIFMMLTVGFICLIFWIGTMNNRLVPTKLQVIIEKLFFFIEDIVKTNIGSKWILIFPYIISLFLFIMIGNILGLFPFAFSFTSQLVVTLGMAIAVFVSSIIIGIRNQGLGYFKHFCPNGIPGYLIPFFVVIEMMSFLFRPISLGIRLFANMVAGHIMIKVISGFAVSIAGVAFVSYLAVIPVTINVLLNVFKLAVCMLQAYVFVVLSCMYLSESFKTSAQH